MKNNVIYLYLFLCATLFMACKSNPVTDAIDIPKATTVIDISDAYNKHDKRKRMNAQERAEFKIDQIKISDSNTDFKSYKTSDLSVGKDIYSGKEGLLRTFLVILIDHSTSEYLASYDSSGNFVDCIQVGEIRVYGGDRRSAVIEKDTVECTSQFEDMEKTTKYAITEGLKFKINT